MSWKKWIVALSTVVFTTQFAPASASSCNSDCGSSSDCGFSLCDCDPCEGWSVYADYLYWRVRRCDLDYAFVRNGADYITDVYDVNPSYDSGFRVGVLKACGDLDFAVHYTWFQGKDDDSLNTLSVDNGSVIGQTKLNPGAVFVGSIAVAGSEYKVELNQVDIEAGYHLEISDCLASRLFAGFRYANIKQHQDTVYSSDASDIYAKINTAAEVDIVYQETDIDFYGLYFGNKASYKVCDCFDFFAGFSLGIGVAEGENTFSHYGKSSGGSSDYTYGDYVDNDCWRAMGVLDLNVGITFPLCNICCTDWAFSVGYEFHHWFNSSSFTDVSHIEGHTDAWINSHCCDLGFDGLFVRLSAAF
jgi:hypothetical protein